MLHAGVSTRQGITDSWNLSKARRYFFRLRQRTLGSLAGRDYIDNRTGFSSCKLRTRPFASNHDYVSSCHIRHVCIIAVRHSIK